MSLVWRIGGAVAVASLPFLSGGCSFTPSVTRLVEGRFREGDFVAGAAYDAFVRGALAEADGRDADALNAYETAIARGPSDALPHVRLAATLARVGQPEAADREIARALAIDPSFAPALDLRARLLGARGKRSEAAEESLAAVRAAPNDPRTIAHAVESGASEALAIEAASNEDSAVEIWVTLLAWAEARDQFALAARSAIWLAEHAPARSAAVYAAAAKLVKRGARVLAEQVAAAAIDQNPRRLGGRWVPPLVARLAVDHALRRGERDKALARATTGRVGRAEIAARAALLGRTDDARVIAEDSVRAEPNDDASRAIATAVRSGPPSQDAPLPASSGGESARPAAVTCVFLARELELRAGDRTKGTLHRACLEGIDGDPLLVR